MSIAYAAEERLCVCGSTHLCGCGCGEELNPNLRRAHELIAAGCTHKQAAVIIGITREGVGTLLRKPPRYVKGHLSAAQRELGRVRQLATNSAERERRTRQHQQHLRRCLAEEFASGSFPWWVPRTNWRWDIAHEFFPSELAAERQERSLREGWPRLVRAISYAARREQANIDRARLKDSRLADKWTRWAVREQKRELAVRDKAQRLAQRAADRETLDDRNFVSANYSLNAPVPGCDEGGDWFAIHEDRYADEPIEAIQRDEFWKLVGDMTPDDVARMGEHELARLQARLREGGFVSIAVTDADRDRVRVDNRHSGGSIPAMGRKHGGRRTRKEQQQVTRDHRIRELPTAEKQRQQQLRATRQKKRTV